MKKQPVSILLVLLLLLSLAPASLASEEADAPADEAAASVIPDEAAAEEPIAEPAEEPAQDGATTSYDLWVMGVQVTSANMDDILGNGKADYDPIRRILSISGNLTAAGDTVAIRSEIARLYISVSKDATLSSNFIAIATKGDATIGGTGKLTVDGGSSGILVQSGTLTVLTDLDVTGGNGISGYDGRSGEALKIGACSVHVTATNIGGIFNFSGITLDRSEITNGGTIKSGYGVYNQRSELAKEITIEPKDYHITVCGTPVTGKNCGDVLGNGNFAYDPQENRLTIENGTVTEDNVIVNSNPGLTVYVSGFFYLTSDGDTVIAEESMTITGSVNSMLTLKSNNGHGLSIGREATVTVKDIWFCVEGGIQGTRTAYGDRGSLAVQNSTLIANRTGGAVKGLGGITLDHCWISLPEGGVVAADGDSIVDMSDKPGDEVNIQPGLLGDLDSSGAADPLDAARILRYYSTIKTLKGDVSRDGKVTVLDAAMVLQISVGLIG